MLSAEAQRIISDKPDAWEYRLTVEVLQTEMAPTIQRWDALKRGLYSKPTSRIAEDASLAWLKDRLDEVTSLTGSFSALANEEFAKAWGEPGQPGDAAAIVSTSKLFAEMCAGALAWEERVRFTILDDVFDPTRRLFIGIAGTFIGEAVKLPSFIKSILDDEDSRGTQTLDMALTCPDGWLEQVEASLQEAAERLALR
ncbi:hypothetical protein [Sphingomonas sp. 3-13AW]|uniref:hypothetical protein n=1 Tax=Sphingomonas sp. 3-13AW TaxID=3050450 RepID=UPI003BB69169